MGRGAAAWVIAGGLLAGASFTACGDDDGGGGGGEPTPDSGAPGVDRDAAADAGGNGGGDATTPDAGLTREEALASTGVNASPARATIVIPLACTKGAECNTLDGETVDSCNMIYGTELAGAPAAGVPEACIDAVLDTLGCTVRLSCAMSDADCGDLYDTQQDLCAGFLDEDDAGSP